MRYVLIALLIVATASCGWSKMFNADAATKWSQISDVQMRQKPSAYSYQRPDGSWVCISTASLKETTTGFVSSKESEILPGGYLVYPGGQKAASINDAIDIAGKIPQGLHFK